MKFRASFYCLSPLSMCAAGSIKATAKVESQQLASWNTHGLHLLPYLCAKLSLGNVWRCFKVGGVSRPHRHVGLEALQQKVLQVLSWSSARVLEAKPCISGPLATSQAAWCSDQGCNVLGQCCAQGNGDAVCQEVLQLL